MTTRRLILVAVPVFGLASLAAAIVLLPGRPPAKDGAGKEPSSAKASSKGAPGQGGLAAAPVDFGREVLPVLSEKCFACHGPDEHTRYGGYRLDIEADAKDPKRKAVVPGKPEESGVVARIHSDNPKQVMPTPDSHKTLTPAQKELITRWIAEGAKWGGHWAYQPIAAPAPPKVSDEAWCKTAADRFVLAKLDEQGFKPSPEADPAQLLRRVTLDLSGLPATPQELAAFEADIAKDGRDGAYAKVVDRLLASPSFGENLAPWWLDLARYADTQGYEKDNNRTQWAWRDWVIKAFNDDLPFDQFAVKQLAGDLLEHPTEQDLVATGFHRNTLTNTEGGTDDEEYRVAAVHDRTHTTMQGFMGLTFMCAQCHTHKYDPILHEDYYHLYAFFNQSEDSDKDDDAPFMPVKGLNGADTHVLIMRDLPKEKARHTYLLHKGSFLDPEKERGEMAMETPKFLPPMPKEAPKNRLGLAQWIVAKENPLTARVQVNRIWARFLGRGIVTSLEDMGLQSAQPTHRELLDYLADAWRTDMKWSVKALCREIVMSAAYRQTSHVAKEAREKDAYNKWLSRGPRGRLSAEQVRDQALAVSGQLNGALYGPPVMPWVPPEAVVAKSFGGVGWHTQAGPAANRRAVYVKWERGFPYPSMATFDTPLRDRCTVSRPPTNTPLQALIALNDGVQVACHQAFARRALAEAKGGPEARIKWAMKTALLREPAAEETAALLEYHAAQTAYYKDHAKEAQLRAADPLGPLPEGVASGEAAAMTDVCAEIMNLDEFLSK